MDNLKNGDTGGKKTLVEEGTQFKGSLSSDLPHRGAGRIDGDVAAPSLQVSATGAVHGKVKVGEIHSQGELAGEFDADVVELSGTVKDKTVVRAQVARGQAGTGQRQASGGVRRVRARRRRHAEQGGRGELGQRGAPAPTAAIANGKNGHASIPPEKMLDLVKESPALPMAELNGDASESSSKKSSPPHKRA